LLKEKLDAEIADERDEDDRHEGGDEDRRREGQTSARRREGPRRDDDRLWPGLALAAFPSPLAEDLVRVEPEVKGVVAEEALRVDRAREVAVVAALEGAAR
jgi:hypothetical protein